MPPTWAAAQRPRPVRPVTELDDMMTTPTATPPTPRRLVRLKEGASYAGCGVRTLRRRIADGSLGGYRSGPMLILVDLNEIDELYLRRIPTGYYP